MLLRERDEARVHFEVPPELIADGPVEADGVSRRDDARLLVARGGAPLVDTTFARLGDHLRAGDILVVNNSATLPAAVPTEDGLVLHLSTELPGGLWVVELRRPSGAGSQPMGDAEAGRVLALPAGGAATLLAPYPIGTDSTGGVRLWVAEIAPAGPLLGWLAEVGRPIRYGDTVTSWPLSAYQTAFASEPGSAEMPSAARAFTPELVARLVARGVVIVPITLHTGVSSQQAGEPPYEERYRVPATTAAVVNAARDAGGRVVAVGTTATRALETVADRDGQVHPGEGWTSHVVTPDVGVRAVDGIVSGWHEPEASHLLLLEAVIGRHGLARAYDAALEHRYRWHEFGDLFLATRT